MIAKITLKYISKLFDFTSLNTKIVEIKDEKVAVLEIRNHIAWYLKGLNGANEIKNKIYLTNKISDIINILEEYKEKFEGVE